MDLRQLECFVTVAESGGFTAAADRLGITQPGVSAQVRKLERELGEALFVRSGRGGVRLTAAGRAALGPARASVASTDAVRSAVVGLSGLLTGRLSLGHVSAGASATLVEPLTRFCRDHPGVEVSLVEDRSARLLEAVADGGLDLAWVGVAEDLPSGVAGRTVLDERLVVAVPPDHRLAGRSRVPFAEVATLRLVAMPRGTGSREAFERGARQAGVAADVALECSSPELIGGMAVRGVGVAVLPEPLAAVLGLVAVPLVGPAVRSRIALVWQDGGPHDPAARAFLSVVAGHPRPRGA